jgi:hypothetical protein
MEQMTLQKYRKIIHEDLEKCGVKIPVELKFDLSIISGAENIAKTKKFLQLCNGDYRNSMYVKKCGERNGDYRYFDLLFCVDKNGWPVCIPVPVARKLFNCDITNTYRAQITGGQYEYIYKAFYNKDELPY